VGQLEDLLGAQGVQADHVLLQAAVLALQGIVRRLLGDPALEAWQTRLEIERMELGGDVTMWLAMNAVTQHIQHRVSEKASNDPLKSQDRRLQENMIGLNSLRTQQVFKLAHSLV
jgi:hypothetical protein